MEQERRHYVTLPEGQYTELLTQLLIMRKHVEELENESVINRVSGIANDKAFEKYLKNLAAQYERYGKGEEMITIVYGDLKKFKPVNDTYGEGTGNEVLKRVAQALHSTTRPEEITCHFWGDSYVTVLLTTDQKAVASAIHRFSEKVAGLEINSVNENCPGIVTPSIAFYPFSVPVTTPTSDIISRLRKEHFETPRS